MKEPLLQFAVSDAVWNALIVMIGGVLLAWLNLRKAEEVKQELKEIAKVGETTHSLVNSSMGRQLRMHMDTSRALADLSHNAVHVEAADLAAKAYEEHQAKEALMDKQEKSK